MLSLINLTKKVKQNEAGLHVYSIEKLTVHCYEKLENCHKITKFMNEKQLKRKNNFKKLSVVFSKARYYTKWMALCRILTYLR